MAFCGPKHITYLVVKSVLVLDYHDCFGFLIHKGTGHHDFEWIHQCWTLEFISRGIG